MGRLHNLNFYGLTFNVLRLFYFAEQDCKINYFFNISRENIPHETIKNLRNEIINVKLFYALKHLSISTQSNVIKLILPNLNLNKRNSSTCLMKGSHLFKKFNPKCLTSFWSYFGTIKEKGDGRKRERENSFVHFKFKFTKVEIQVRRVWDAFLRKFWLGGSWCYKNVNGVTSFLGLLYFS